MVARGVYVECTCILRALIYTCTYAVRTRTRTDVTASVTKLHRIMHAYKSPEVYHHALQSRIWEIAPCVPGRGLSRGLRVHVIDRQCNDRDREAS